MSNSTISGKSSPDGRDVDDHLADVDDGCGCVEVWEHLSERRSSE